MHDCHELTQDLLKLEAIQKELAHYNGGEPTFSQWAEAAGTDENTLRKRLTYGIYCKNTMVRSNVRLVISIAREFEGPGMEFSDLIQVFCKYFFDKIGIASSLLYLPFTFHYVSITGRNAGSGKRR